jgi:hypothetical protein
MTGFPAPRRGLFRAFLEFWAEPTRAEPLALFRILIGLIAFLSTATTLAPRLGADLGPDGFLPATAVDGWESYTKPHFNLFRGPTGIRGVNANGDKWNLDEILLNPESLVWGDGNLDLGRQRLADWRAWCDDPVHAYLLLAALLVALTFLTLGLATRPAVVVSWALFVSFNARLIWLNNGGDSMLRCALFWSIDRLLWRRRTPVPLLIPPWAVRLMQIQLAFVYFFTGLAKLGGDWFRGEAVYWVLNDISLNRFPYAWFPVPLWVIRLMSWGTLVFEMGFPFFVIWDGRRRVYGEVRGKTPEEGFRFRLNVPALRPWLLLAGVALHMGILVHTEVGWFSPATMAWYVLFLRGETLAWVVRPFRWRGKMHPAPMEEQDRPVETIGDRVDATAGSGVA